MLHLFLKSIAIQSDKFISLAPAASSKDVYTFIVILAQLWCCTCLSVIFFGAF